MNVTDGYIALIHNNLAQLRPSLGLPPEEGPNWAERNTVNEC